MKLQAIEVAASDGVILRGQHWLGGDVWAVLFHEAGKDLDCWHRLVSPLLERGYSLCTVDMRGHGISDGDWDVSTLDGDLESVMNYVLARKAVKVAFIGAGESALPGLIERYAQRLFAIVCLSPGPLGVLSANELRGAGVPRLFIFGSKDEVVEKTASQLRNRAIGWTVLLRLPTSEQGTALLSEPWGLQVQEHAIAFLEEQRYRSAKVTP